VIASFGDKVTEEIYHGLSTKRSRRFPPPGAVRTACRKLDLVEYAHVLQDLRVPPGNRLEALRGSLRGYHSIRVNEQWRIIFQWRDGAAHNVSIVDYHTG
jgi:proteic killer suppression protein